MFETIHTIVNNTNPNQSGVVERFGSVGNIAVILINLISMLGFAISFVAIALSAVKYTLVGGEPEKAQSAWRTFLYGLIGAAISLGVFAIKNIIVKAIGVTDPNIVGIPGSGVTP